MPWRHQHCAPSRADFNLPIESGGITNHMSYVITETTCGLTIILVTYSANRFRYFVSLRWRHNDHDSVSNHQPHGCLLNRLFRRRSKKTSNLRVTGLCVGNSPGPVNSPHKGPVTQKMFPFDDVIMWRRTITSVDMANCHVDEGISITINYVGKWSFESAVWISILRRLI